MNLVPDVIDKTLKKSKFDPKKVYSSLLRETSLDEEQAKIITEDATRCMIAVSGSIKHITAPMIREVINSVLLKHGFEKQRLQYTRIGIPMFDLENLLTSNLKQDDAEIDYKIKELIRYEFNNVKKLIKTIEENGV